MRRPDFYVRWHPWVRRAGFLSIKRWQGRGSIPCTAQQRNDSSVESAPALHSETRSVQIRNSSKPEHWISLYYAALGHEISTQKIPRVTVWLVWETRNFMARICSSSPPQQSIGVSRTHPCYPELKEEHPEIQKVLLRQDNADCYHSTATILSVPAVEKATGLQVAEVGFSDPQGGRDQLIVWLQLSKDTSQSLLTRVTMLPTRKRWRRRFSLMVVSLEFLWLNSSRRNWNHRTATKNIWHQ